MTLRLFQLLLGIGAAALLSISLLVVFRSPDWSYWQLALLAGEFGHWLALFSFGLVPIAWMTRGNHSPTAVAIMLPAVLAGALFCKPILQARGLKQEVAEKLTRAFGTTDPGGTPFSLSALVERRPDPVMARTLSYTADLSLDFYAVGRPANAPCVILIHGGGWDSGRRDEFLPFNHWLAGKGYGVAAISYRLAPKFPWPAQREDIAAALTFLKANAASLGIDATRFVLIGRSAGGHLAEAAAYSQRNPSVRGVVALYAPADVHFAWEFARDDDVLKSPQLLRNFLGGTPETHRAAYDSASPIRFVDKNTPPTLLIHGQLDTLVWHRQSERLDAKLTEAGVRHAFISLPWATHAFEYNLNGPGGQITRYSIEQFLAAVTKSPGL